jgi:hypothetical protein
MWSWDCWVDWAGEGSPTPEDQLCAAAKAKPPGRSAAVVERLIGARSQAEGVHGPRVTAVQMRQPQKAVCRTEARKVPVTGKLRAATSRPPGQQTGSFHEISVLAPLLAGFR